MAIPVPANTTCDVYRAGGNVSNPPDVAGVACYLQADYQRRLETGESMDLGFRYTHVMLVDVAVDVRDSFNAWVNTGSDDVYVPDRQGTRFTVRFVARHNKGSSFDHKRVYLDRFTPAWPSNNL